MSAAAFFPAVPYPDARRECRCCVWAVWQGVYRVSFALAVFFLAMTVLAKCMPLIHRGGWLWKYLALFGLVVIAFIIPNSKWERSGIALRWGVKHPRGCGRAPFVVSSGSVSGVSCPVRDRLTSTAT